MDANDIKKILEALLFITEQPVPLKTLETLFDPPVPREDLLGILHSLAREYAERGSALEASEIAGGWQFSTRPEFAPWIRQLFKDRLTYRLSSSAMETLSIVAYKQPITRSEIEEIRGVDSGGVLKTLLERGYIRIVGRREEPGNPIIYGTTPAFLELFDLKSLEELPALRSIEELAEEQRQEAQGKEWGFDEEISELIDENEEELGNAIPEDLEMIQELDQSMKNLRTLEKEIFPKERVAGEEQSSGETVEEKDSSWKRDFCLETCDNWHQNQ